MQSQIIPISNGAEGIFIKNGRFNTTLISCNFYQPLRRDTEADFALLPFILTSCSKKYPDFSLLNYKLNRLYGARLDASTEKYGDYQLLRMTVSVINDRFTLDSECLISQAIQLLLGLVFEPNVDDGAFLAEDVAREKRKAIEHIKSEYSEKRIYAKNRLTEKMYEGKAYGIPKCRSVADVEKITGESLFKAWQQMLKTAFIRIHVVGAAAPAGLFDEISQRFEGIERSGVISALESQPTFALDEARYFTDYMDVSQGKLVMGFSSDIYGNDEETLALLVANDIFGGGPYSRLFANVREKMSLCYYCAASAVRQKGLVTVESGVETENAEKAEKEILNQLEIIKKGEFSDFEFNSSIKSICDSFNTYNDSQNLLDMWYAVKVNNSRLYTPSELAQKVAEVTREDVISAAKGITLNTVYKLLPKEAKK